MKRCLTSFVNREIQFKTTTKTISHTWEETKKKKEKEERVSIGTGGAAQTLLWFTSVIPEGENSTLGIPQEERKQKSIQRLTHECIQRLYS